jgi:hypothetical protein
VTDRFHVVFVAKMISTDLAETSTMTLCEAAKVALRAAPTLAGTVKDLKIGATDKEKVFQGDWNIIAVRLTVETLRFASA